MLFLCLVLLTISPVSDSALQQQCQAEQLDYQEVCSIFSTLDGIFLLEQKYYRDSSKYFTINVMRDDVSIDSFQNVFDVTLPTSLITASDYKLVISHKLDGEEADTCTVLLICVYNDAAENNMPIARLTYCQTADAFCYEFNTRQHHIEYYRRP